MKPDDLTPVLILPPRNLNGLYADAVLEEKHTHELVITDHPVEQGSVISDHAYKLPAEVTVTYVWSLGGKINSTRDPTFLVGMYDKLLRLQVERTLFKLVTGKKLYKNMLIQSCQMTNDEKTENVLLVRIVCREILMAITQTVNFTDAASQLLPNKTAPSLNQGSVNLQPTNLSGRP